MTIRMSPASMMVWLASLAAAAAVGAGATMFAKKDDLPPPLISIERAGQLVSLKVNYSDVLEFTEPRSMGIPWSQWSLPYAGTTVLVLAKGECYIATDLRRASYRGVDPRNRSVTIVAPAPATFQPRVNHVPADQGGTKIYAISNRGIESIIPGDGNRIKAVESAMTLAQRKIADACTNPDAVTEAKASAEKLLATSFNAIGWNASVEWK